MNGQMNIVIRLTDYFGLCRLAWFWFFFSPVVPGWTDIPFYFLYHLETNLLFCHLYSPQFGCCFLLLCSALFPFCYWLFSQFSVAINQYDSLVFESVY